jgi:hypothetical protein
MLAKGRKVKGGIMRNLNASIRHIPMSSRIRRLPISDRGFPIPWFVAYVNGEPDFRVADTAKMAEAIKFRKCWVCGGALGKYMCFVIGPMCAVNRVSSEPPSHHDCAEYAVKACPFLAQPRMRRNMDDMPKGHLKPGGVMIERNPGVTLIWTTFSYEVIGRHGIIRIGEPETVRFFCRGRKATNAEIMESIDSGMPILKEMARNEGPTAEKELAHQYHRAMKLIPAE